MAVVVAQVLEARLEITTAVLGAAETLAAQTLVRVRQTKASMVAQAAMLAA